MLGPGLDQEDLSINVSFWGLDLVCAAPGKILTRTLFHPRSVWVFWGVCFFCESGCLSGRIEKPAGLWAMPDRVGDPGVKDRTCMLKTMCDCTSCRVYR